MELAEAVCIQTAKAWVSDIALEAQSAQQELSREDITVAVFIAEVHE
jgi:hypothetical protein